MYILNVTSKVTWPIHEAWLQWMKEVHIPGVMATGCFTRSRILRLLETDEAEGPTYAIQYTALDLGHYETFVKQFDPALRLEMTKKWGDRYIAFRSLMQEVE